MHVVMPIGKGIGLWNTQLWGLHEASAEIDMVCEDMVKFYLFLLVRFEGN